MLIKILKKMSGMENDSRLKGYNIMRYWHPDSGKKPEFVKHCHSLEEAQKHCQDPSTSVKEGDASQWYWDGYVEAGSNTTHITLWDIFST